MASSIDIREFGAYTVDDDPAYYYYLVKWTGDPFKVDNNEVMHFGNGVDFLNVFAGDWVCRGVWL